MMNVTQLRERIAKEFPDAAQVSDSVVRFIRSAGSRPYAVCFVDVAEDLPRTHDALIRYQDQLIGRYYFEGPKSLQWSNYLYFMTAADRLAASEIQRAKKMIEGDRSYARKFVIAEDELDAVLSPPIVPAKDADVEPNVLSIWTQRLVEAGLDAAILAEADLPKRLFWIESASDSEPPTPPKTPSHPRRQQPPVFIRSLRLIRYRTYPLLRDFGFGTVNLIVGPNAAGKTSLLEAIELYYCGRNKRSGQQTAPYELEVGLADDRTDKATNRRPLKLFRDRNLFWYGRPEIKTNYLFQSFAQFNFLDTDAAVNISASTEHIEDDLSKLLVGPDASKIWGNMKRVSEALAVRLRELRKMQRQINDERALLQKRLAAQGEIKQESDSIAARLIAMLERLNWSRPQPDDLEQATADLASSLSELAALAEQASALMWVPAPASIERLSKFTEQAGAVIGQAAPAIDRLEALVKEQRTLKQASDRANQALSLAEQAKRMIEAGVAERAQNRAELLDDIARLGALLAGSESISLDGESSDGEALQERLARVQSQRLQAEKALDQTRLENSRFTSLRDRSFNLAQQLRQIAGEILKDSPSPDECPLCHTVFAPGELAVHMTHGVDAHMEQLGQTLLDRMVNQEAALSNSREAEVANLRLREFADRSGISDDAPVATVLAKLATTRQALIQARERLETIESEMQTLGRDGLSSERLQALISQLSGLGHPLTEPTGDAPMSLISSLRKGISEFRDAIERLTAQVNAEEDALEKRLPDAERGLNEGKVALAQLMEREAATRSISDGLGTFAAAFPWPAEVALAELVVSARSVRTVASELQTALGRENSDRQVYAESAARKKHLDEQIEELEPSVARVSSACDTLTTLMKENELTAAMESALVRNRAAIESIFSSIHSPAEFSGLGSKFDTLVRKTGGDASLKEISAGQRAAFALSIFLAQNSQLKTAPPVMLIDDPIAHVDDLNSLSFLDYLREVAIRGQRQIFFATANEKIASLFERKFDFLGEADFRKIELSRQPA
jgi:DNA repair exonuclease SbcCD ATPase subunit